MTKQTTLPGTDPVYEQNQQVESPKAEPAVKKSFVEPTVSVPTDVLEATTFFQAPTIESATT